MVPELKTNLSYNALDRHVSGPRKNKVAYYWEGEAVEGGKSLTRGSTGESSILPVHLGKLGVKRRRQRVTIYLPMIPELPISMLATVRLGAIHSVIFAGVHGAISKTRINDSKSTVVITADGSFRKGKTIELKSIVDEAIKQAPSIEKVIVVRRTGSPVTMNKGPGRTSGAQDLIGSADTFAQPEPLHRRGPELHPLHVRDHWQTKGTTHSTAADDLCILHPEGSLRCEGK